MVFDLLCKYALGDYSAKVEISERRDDIDAIIVGVTMLGEELAALSEAQRRAREELETKIRERTTELRKTSEQFLQAQKMEAVGRLAGGVAHDFNNLLSIILSYSAMLMDDLKPGDPMRADLAEIKKAGERAAGLTRQLLAFSRRQVLRPKILDVNEVLAGTEKMLRRLIGEDIDLVLFPGAGIGKVKVDQGQLEQVIMNLAVNARDAMPGGGKLTIETQNAKLDETYASSHVGVVPGSYVMLALSDNGIGMDQTVQTRLFEPFLKI